MSKMLATEQVVAVVVDEEEDSFIAVFDTPEEAEAFIRDYNASHGRLKMKVEKSVVYKYPTTDGI